MGSDTSSDGRAPAGRGPGILAMVLASAALLVGPQALDFAMAGRPCSYRVRTGRPCASCGGTRAFALTARGRLRDAWEMNPLGLYAGISMWALGLAGAAATLARRHGPLISWAIAATVTGPAIFAWTVTAWLCRLP